MLVATAQYPFVSELLRDVLYAFSFILLVTAWFFVKRLPSLLSSVRAAGWLPAEGKVETVMVSTFSEQSLAEVAYSYVAEGERYAGYFARQFVDEQDAWDYIRPLKGQSLLVRYKPGSPSASAVRITEQNPLFVGAQQNFARRWLSRSVEHLLGGWNWQELTVFSARSWPISKGKVESGTVTQHRMRELWYLVTFYTSEVTYSYVVGGEYYSGYFQRTFLREDAAQKFTDALKGSEVVVRYKPDSPTVSFLRRQDQQNAIPTAKPQNTQEIAHPF